MDDYQLGQIVGYLRSIECPQWVEDIIEDIHPSGKKKKGKRVAAQDNDADHENNESSAGEESAEDEGGGETDAESPWEKFKVMYDEEKGASEMADELGLSIQVIYAWRAKRKKQLADGE